MNDPFIEDHVVVGKINVGWNLADVLTCKHCGVVLWDVRKHMLTTHAWLVDLKDVLPPRGNE